jgi:hypothetical protein
MPLISLGDINIYIVYALIGGIGKCIAGTLLYIYKNDLKKFPFMLGANAGLGLTLSIIPHIFIKIKYRGINIQPRAIDKNLYLNKEYYKNYNEKSIKINKFFIILLAAFLDFFQKLLVFLFSYSIDNNVWIFNIIFLNVFSICILKTKLYKHQIISSSIMILLGIFLNILLLKDMTVEKIPALLLSIFIETIYSLSIVVSKYGMEHCFCSPLEINFYQGLFAFIVNVIFLSISTNIPVPNSSKLLKYLKHCEYKDKEYLDNFFAYLKYFKGKEIIMFIITMLSRWIFSLFALFTIKYYTPSHVILLLILGEIQNTFFDIKNIHIRVIAIVIYFFLFSLLLIFTEIIILRFWGLEKDTKIMIASRAITQEIEEQITGDYSGSGSGRDSGFEIEDGIEINFTKN